MTNYTTFYDELMPRIPGLNPGAFAINKIREAAIEFFRRTRVHRVDLAIPISLKWARVVGVTNANPAVVTTDVAHDFQSGDVVLINNVVGMPEINNVLYIVASPTSTTFQLNGIDSTAFAVFSGNGQASLPIYTVIPPVSNAIISDVVSGRFNQNLGVSPLPIFPSSGLNPLTKKSAEELDVIRPGWRGEISGAPIYMHMFDATRVRFAPGPGQVWKNAISMTVALEPSAVSVDMDDNMFNRYYLQIAKGAAAKLLQMPNSPWSNDKKGIDYQQDFDTEISKARIFAEKGRMRGISVANPRSFGF